MKRQFVSEIVITVRGHIKKFPMAREKSEMIWEANSRCLYWMDRGQGSKFGQDPGTRNLWGRSQAFSRAIGSYVFGLNSKEATGY